MQKLNILIIGGTGFIGRTLAYTLLHDGHKVSVLSRNQTPHSFIEDGITWIQADVSKPGSWQNQIPDFDVVINLSGASIFRQWTNRGKREILDSRIVTTGNIVEAVAKRRGVIRQFITVSGVGYYGFRGDETVIENSAPGSDFIAQVAIRWEEAAQRVMEQGVSLVICRLGHVLGSKGGVFPRLLALARFHLGSHWGSGNQWISWIHEQDLARAFLFLVNRPDITGALNITSPNPVRNKELMKTLTDIIGSKALIVPVPGFALKLMAGEFSSVFINGQKVIPDVLIKNGFTFEFSELARAIASLIPGKQTVTQ
jgi:uncharacterized protein